MKHQRLPQRIIGFTSLAVLLLSACGAPQATAVPTAVASPSPATEQTQFTDPFAYCAAVGIMDTPDARYTGTDTPEVIVNGLRKVLGTPDDAPMEPFVAGTFWRCMDGKVWACFVGANLPCTEKADTSRTPTPDMADFCKANPNSDFIPAYITGRATVYEWRCTNGAPEIVKQIVEPDAQGFQSNIWYEISPGDDS
jgi:hypothetical protein